MINFEHCLIESLQNLPIATFITNGEGILLFGNKYAVNLLQTTASNQIPNATVNFLSDNETIDGWIKEPEKIIQKHKNGQFAAVEINLFEQRKQGWLHVSTTNQQNGTNKLFVFAFLEANFALQTPNTAFKSNSKDIAGSDEYFGIIAHHEKAKEVIRLIQLAAESDASVLITGESGTGKEMVADAIHYASVRNNKPFVKVNCSALSESLLESELFGHVKGAFTGAIKDKVGKFEAAQGGTIFLDEIGDISPLIQLKLLRVLQEKTIEKVGDNKSVKVNIRIITATNKNLRDLVREGKFREDLFYRLHVFPIQIPPLRERKTDIPLLCNHFLQKYNKITGKQLEGYTENAMRILLDYCWPGNIRELENAIEHAFVLCNNSYIDVFDLPQDIRLVSLREGLCKGINSTNKPSYFVSETKENTIILNDSTLKLSEEQQKQRIVAALTQHHWNRKKTALALGISRVALWQKMKHFGLQ